MKAVVYHDFGGRVSLEAVADPTPANDGAVIQVEATGLCRSDWHGWRGHDPDIKRFPHVPGHEFAGIVVAVGSVVSQALIGRRVTIPFVAGCGACEPCASGSPQVCDRQYQPGFTGWGSFAEYVAVRYAEGNLVELPPGMSAIAGAALGCRLATAYRAVSAQGAVKAGDWVAVHGCGGVGLSAVMVARALGARVVGVDIRDEPLAMAKMLGADFVINATEISEVSTTIHDITGGGADVSLDALGSAATFANSIQSLRKRGRHVQVGLLTSGDKIPASVFSRLIGWELEIVGSHGIQAQAYAGLFDLIAAGKLDPMRLVNRTLPLDDAPHELVALDSYLGRGVTVFTPFSGGM